MRNSSLLIALLGIAAALPSAHLVWAQQPEIAPGGPTEVQTANLIPAHFSCPFCDLSNAQLAGKNLTNANLQGANLNHANLEGAILDGAILEGANLTDANLKGAHMNRSDKGPTDLVAATLTGAQLQGAILNGTNLHHVNLSEFSHDGVDLRKALIVNPQIAATSSSVTCGKADLSGLAKQVFVSTTGSDNSSCGTSATNACATVNTAISRCSGTAHCGVLVMYGEYKLTQTIALADGVNVYGGCLSGGGGAQTPIQSLLNAPGNGQPVVSANGITSTGVLLQGFRLQGSAAPPRSSAASVTVQVSNSPNLQIADSYILSGAGGSGAVGGDGSAGADGVNGNGATAGSSTSCQSAAGGNGSVKRNVSVDVSFASAECKPSCSSNGCNGYYSPTGSAGGPRGGDRCKECVSDRGDTGGGGAAGSDAGCGQKGRVSGDKLGRFSGTSWQSSVGGNGSVGGFGHGGGGGGSGGYKAGACFWVKQEYAGNQGGGGGSGGCGGGPGIGGRQGGGAFAVVVAGGKLALSNTVVVGGRSGDGGPGGNGKSGGKRSTGAGGLGNEGGGYGGTGGAGGAGGAGGGGAGGNGGPAIGVALISGASVSDSGTVYYTGASGNPGGYGNGGQPIVSGLCTGPNGDDGVAGSAADKQSY